MQNVSEVFGQGRWSKGVHFLYWKAQRPVFRTEKMNIWKAIGEKFGLDAAVASFFTYFNR